MTCVAIIPHPHGLQPKVALFSVIEEKYLHQLWTSFDKFHIMCIYRRCCCCCSVLVGAKIIAIIGLISGFINLLLDVIIIVGDSRNLTNGFDRIIPGLRGFRLDRKLYFRFATFPVISYFFEYIGTIPTMTIFILVTLLVLICNLLMFCGTLKKKPGLIIPWLVTMLILNIVSMKFISFRYIQ